MDNNPEQNASERLADDLLIGAAAIGKELGVKEDAVYHIVKTKRLPIGRMGKTLMASRRKLRRAVQVLTS
jgi:hypothetical protein